MLTPSTVSPAIDTPGGLIAAIPRAPVDAGRIGRVDRTSVCRPSACAVAGCRAALAVGAQWAAQPGGLSERPMETVLKTVGAVANPSPGVRIPRPPHQS